MKDDGVVVEGEKCEGVDVEGVKYDVVVEGVKYDGVAKGMKKIVAGGHCPPEISWDNVTKQYTKHGDGQCPSPTIKRCEM